jgi:hypothetical protein
MIRVEPGLPFAGESHLGQVSLHKTRWFQASSPMVELGWTASEVTQEHLQKLVSQGYMPAMELVTCCVIEDPASSVQVGDASWCVRCSMSAGLVRHRTNFSSHYCSLMA